MERKGFQSLADRSIDQIGSKAASGGKIFKEWNALVKRNTLRSRTFPSLGIDFRRPFRNK